MNEKEINQTYVANREQSDLFNANLDNYDIKGEKDDKSVYSENN